MTLVGFMTSCHSSFAITFPTIISCTERGPYLEVAAISSISILNKELMAQEVQFRLTVVETIPLASYSARISTLPLVCFNNEPQSKYFKILPLIFFKNNIGL